MLVSATVPLKFKRKYETFGKAVYFFKALNIIFESVYNGLLLEKLSDVSGVQYSYNVWWASTLWIQRLQKWEQGYWNNQWAYIFNVKWKGRVLVEVYERSLWVQNGYQDRLSSLFRLADDNSSFFTKTSWKHYQWWYITKCRSSELLTAFRIVWPW